jgi:hypothetical protein
MEAHMTDEIRKSTTLSPLDFLPGFGELGRKHLEAAAEMQRALLDSVQDLNRTWAARVQSEVTLASELADKLAAARSMADLAGAYQDCVSRQLELAAEDGRRMFADGEKLLKAGVRGFRNGFPAGLGS